MEKKFWVRSGRFYPFGTRHHYFEEGQDILKTKTGVKLVSQCNIYSKLSFFLFFFVFGGWGIGDIQKNCLVILFTVYSFLQVGAFVPWFFFFRFPLWFSTLGGMYVYVTGWR